MTIWSPIWSPKKSNTRPEQRWSSRRERHASWATCTAPSSRLLVRCCATSLRLAKVKANYSTRSMGHDWPPSTTKPSMTRQVSREVSTAKPHPQTRTDAIKRTSPLEWTIFVQLKTTVGSPESKETEESSPSTTQAHKTGLKTCYGQRLHQATCLNS